MAERDGDEDGCLLVMLEDVLAFWCCCCCRSSGSFEVAARFADEAAGGVARGTLFCR